MVLPFYDDENKDKKKYQCFICGNEFLVFNDFKQHIFDEHEEGREYIKCCLPHCQAPVRDLRQHFKSKHPAYAIPTTGQMKALIWKDQGKNGKLKQRKPKFREGYMSSNKNGKDMHYRSGYECKVYEILESDPNVLRYDVEPFPIKYSFNGETHDYFPDLIVYYVDPEKPPEVLEIKPSAQTSLPKNKAKWTFCQQYCESRGYNFIVLTEKGIELLRKKVLNESN